MNSIRQVRHNIPGGPVRCSLALPRVRERSKIEISLGLLDFQSCGSLDLDEIYQFRPWKGLAFQFSQIEFCTSSHELGPKSVLHAATISPQCIVKSCLRRLRIARSWREICPVRPRKCFVCQFSQPHLGSEERADLRNKNSRS